MADTTIHQLQVSLPGAGQTQTYQLEANTPVKFNFDLADAVFTGVDGNLQITVEGGGTIILENYQALADTSSLPLFEMINGEQVAGDVYLFAFDGLDQNADVETAAGNATGSSGAGQYNDDPGTLGTGIEALDGQGDAYGTHSFTTLSGVLNQAAPVANDDTASITEEGDSDVFIGRHIIFVDSPEGYEEALGAMHVGDGPAVSEFFPLSSGGGFYISYPNPPQVNETIEGNVTDNDVDPNGDDNLLTMYTMDYVGVNHDGVDPAPVEITANDTTIVGKYGVLVIDTNGHWEYTLNQAWADSLDEGDSYDEVFSYTITDSEGLVSNTATLTITVNGSNDMPEAHDDLNVQAVETGDSTDYALHASVYDADLNDGTGGDVTVHDSDHYDYTQTANTLVTGNVLAGDDAGGVTDTDVDGDDSPDGQSMFVIGVYSQATETVDYIVPDEQNPDFTPTDTQAYDQAGVAADASVSVNGEFGVLTIHADGSYEYQLYTAEDGDAYDALNALNYGSEDNVDSFTYGIMDDSGAFSYANISFTVNGANDAPEAFADSNNVAEFGIRFLDSADYSAEVSGNVITGESSGDVADTDVDDSLMYVASVSSQTGDSDTLYTDDHMDTGASVTIDGEYGTLTINADGSYTYTLNNEAANVQALNEGDLETDVFTYTLTNSYADGVYSEPTTLTINVSGSNDAPVAVADANAFTESVDLEDAVSVNGNLLAGDANGGVADTDVDNSLSDFTVTGVTSDNTTNTAATDTDGYDFVLKGEYGTLYLNEDGSYKYVEDQNATNSLNNDSDPVTDVFTYTMSDNEATNTGSSSSTLTITITGANDAPVAMADTNTLTESVDGADAASVLGNVLTGDANGGVADTDVDNSVSEFTVTGVSSDNTTNATATDTDGYDYVLHGEYGTLYLNEDGSYKYVEDPDATDSLNEGDVKTDVFTYTMSDNQDGDAKESSSTLTIVIDGANDAPVAADDYNLAKEAGFYTDGFDASGNVIHGQDILGGLINIGGDSDVDNATLTVTHVVSDDNAGSESDVSGTTAIVGKYGTLYIEADGSYHYEVNNDSQIVQELNVNDAPTDSFTYTVSDGMGGTDTATLEITVWGSDDAPLAVDDTNTGSVVEAGVDEAGNAVAHGYVLANDSDVDSSYIFMAKAGAGAEGSETGGQTSSSLFGWSSVEGQYGTLYFKASGEYRYVLNNNDPDTQALAEGEVVYDQFNYTASDLLGATDEATLSIEITGSNDAAVITGDSSGAVTEDVDVTAADLLTDSGQLFASDVDNTDNLFQTDTITDSQGGTFHINADGTWTYEISNESVQHLGEVDGVNDGFSNDFTVYSADGTEHTVTVTVSGDNDAPLGADFSVHASAYGEPVTIDFDQAPITDVEDDYSASDGLDTGVVITSLPDNGTLYYDGHEVTQADIDNGTRFDDLDNFTYVADTPSTQGVLIGSREADDAGLDTWGERVNASTRQLSVDTDGDGTSDVTITTQISSGKLKVYADQQDHIDHGLANASHNGLDSGETMTMTFEGKDVSYAEIGFGGLGSYFDDGSAQDAEATWAVYNDGQLVASGTVNNSVMTWTNAITGESGTITGGDGDTFQSLVLDQTILGGESFDQIVFGTTEDGAKDWNANWELQYVDVEFAGSDSFTYQPVDSEGLVSDDTYTVTVDVLAGAANEDPTAVDDAASVHEPNSDGLDYSVSANVLANDVDADNTQSEMSLTKVTFDDTTVDFVNHTITGDDATFNADGTVTIQGEHGTLTIGADGEYTYTATDNTLVPGDAPTETFTYTMTDGDTVDNDDVAQTANLVITVNGLNDAPDAVDDGVAGLDGTTHDVTLNIANGFTADGITIVADQTTDSTVINSQFGLGVKTGSGDNSAIDTTQGEEKVTFQFDDPQTEATITLADFNQTDHDDDAIITLLNADGEVVGTYTVGTDQTNPTIDLTGSEPFVYVVVEPAGGSEDGFYVASISGQVTDYSSTDGAIVTAEDTPISIDVLGNDTDPDIPNDSLTITGLTDPAHGTVAIVNGEVLYTPDADYNGADSFTYTITDEYGATDTATVYLNVTPVNDAPVAADDAVTILEGDVASGNVISGAEVVVGEGETALVGQDTDIDGDTLNVTQFTVEGDATVYSAGETAHIDGVGDLVINTDGTYSFTPEGDYNGDVPVATYTVSDGMGGTDEATLTIEITPTNDAPVAVDDTASGSGWTSDDGSGSGATEGSTVYSLVAQEYDGSTGTWVSATVSDWGSGGGTKYGVESSTDGGGNDKYIENHGVAERLLIDFNDPQDSVSIKLTGDGASQESIQAWDADGNEITDLVVTESGDILTISSPTSTIDTVVVMADDGGSVALKSVSSVAAEIGSTATVYEAAVLHGNVLANDYDADNVDYTDGSGYPSGSTELTVTGAAAGNLDNLTQAQYDQLLTDGDFNGDSGTFSLADDGEGVTIHGLYGDLVIAEDGSYTYTTYDGLDAGTYTESFTYQVSDPDGGVDYGVIEVDATIGNPPLVANAELGHAAEATEVQVEVPSTEYVSGDTTHVNFNDVGGANNWSAVSEQLGLQVSGTTSTGDPSQVVQVGAGIGLSSSDLWFVDGNGYFDDSYEIGQGTDVAFTPSMALTPASEAIILDFGNNGVEEPQNVSITVRNVSDSEDLVITVKDTDGNTYVFHTQGVGNNTVIYDANGSGVTLFKGNNEQYVVQGTQVGSDGTGEVLIDTVTIAAGENTSFTLAALDVTAGGSWEGSGTHYELQQTALPVSGYLIDSAYSADDSATSVAIIGSGIGTWGTIEITDATTGAWTYTPNESAVFDDTTGLTGPAVEEFTYQVTDSHGQTDTATLYVPVTYNATEGDHGTAGHDLVYGTEGHDTISGLEGNDFLYGEGGDDIIDGGQGHDFISGGEGADTLHGGAGNDYLFGGNGNDTLWGGSGDDHIFAGGGDDNVFVSSGHDTVTLGSGADTISIDPTYLTAGDGDATMTVTDFNIGEGDHVALNNLTSGVIDVTSSADSGDLVLTISDVNSSGDDITITLQGVLPTSHDVVDHAVNLDAGDDLNSVVQHIINSGGHPS